jgi:hypothetical protein
MTIIKRHKLKETYIDVSKVEINSLNESLIDIVLHGKGFHTRGQSIKPMVIPVLIKKGEVDSWVLKHLNNSYSKLSESVRDGLNTKWILSSGKNEYLDDGFDMLGMHPDHPIRYNFMKAVNQIKDFV